MRDFICYNSSIIIALYSHFVKNREDIMTTTETRSNQKILVNYEKLKSLINVVWDETTLCPPDGRADNVFGGCFLWENVKNPCEHCWFDYLCK